MCASVRVNVVCVCGAVPCSAGSFFEVAEGTCKSCPPGTYQPLEGQVTCLICPNMAATHGVGIEGASDVTDCKCTFLFPFGTVKLLNNVYTSWAWLKYCY